MDVQPHHPRLDRNPPRAVLMRFGVSMFCLAAACGAIMQWGLHEATAARWMLAFGVTTGCGALIPGLGRRLYVAWMLLGLTLGRVTSPIMLAVFFYAVITPCGLVLRLFRHDALQRRTQREAATYWQAYGEPEDRARYFKSF